MEYLKRTLLGLHAALGLCIALAPLACGENIVTLDFPGEGDDVDAGADADGGGDAGTDGGGNGPGGCPGECVPFPDVGWSDPFLLWYGPAEESAPPCPAQAPKVVYSGHADIAATNLCPICLCEDPACVLPAGLVASESNLCQGPMFTPFDAPPGWDGACVAPTTIPTNLLASVSIEPPTVSPCKPKTAPVPKAGDMPQWMTDAVACGGEVVGPCKDHGTMCVSSAGTMLSEFRHCVYRLDGGDAACPADYPDKHVFYEAFKDTRDCTACACDPPAGSDCSAVVSAYTDQDCTAYLTGSLMTLSGSTCNGVAPNMNLKSMSAQWATNQPGTCTPTGGQPIGDVKPTQATTWCCQSAAM